MIMENLDGTSDSRCKTGLLDDARWIRLAVGLWVALAVAVCVKSITTKNDHTIYPILAWGSRHWWADQPLHAEYPGLTRDIYRYSPTFAISFTPLALLPDWLGSSLWGVLSVGTTFCAMRLFFREILPGSWPPRSEAYFLVLTAFGSMSGIWSGQSNSLILSMVIFAAVAIKHNRWWAACILLVLPAFIKIWPIMPALLLMVFWPKQLSWRLAVVGVAMLLIPFLTRPFHIVVEQYQEWYLSLLKQEQHRWGGFRDAWTILENLHLPISKRPYQVLQFFSLMPMFLWCFYERRRMQSFPVSQQAGHDRNYSAGLPETTEAKAGDATYRRLVTVLISIWVSWQLFFGPGAEQLTYGIIAPSAAWAVLTSFEERKNRLWTVATWLSLVLFSCGEFETPLTRLHPAFIMLLPLGVVSFVAWMIWHERRWRYPVMNN
jgi:Glycosyltransferase family 87